VAYIPLSLLSTVAGDKCDREPLRGVVSYAAASFWSWMMLWLVMRWSVFVYWTFLLLVALTAKLTWFGFFYGVTMFWKLLWYPMPFMALPVSGLRSALLYSAIAILNLSIRCSVLSSSRWAGCFIMYMHGGGLFRVDAGGEGSGTSAQSPLACSITLISMEPDDILLAFFEVSIFLSSP
jgi:hypothetical protein